MKGKIYKKTANDSKSYFGYLNKLVDKYNNSYHCSIGKKPFDTDHSALPEETELSLKASKFKFGNRVTNILSNNYTEMRSRQIFVINCVMKILINL